MMCKLISFPWLEAVEANTGSIFSLLATLPALL